MLSVISFTWFDVFPILIVLLLPVFMVIMTIFLIAKSASHPGVRALLLWLVLPQIIAALIFWCMLEFYNVYSSSNVLFIASGSMLVGVFLNYLFFSIGASSILNILCGHAIYLVLFLIGISNTHPNLLTELQVGRDRYHLLRIGQGPVNESLNRRLKDKNFRQKMLVEAVNNKNMPETTFQELLARGADPFQKNEFNNSILSIAVKHHNINAVRVFIEILDDNKKGKNNREFLRSNNPLEESFYFSIIPTEEEKKQYMDTAKIILDKMPELLTDGAYLSILRKANVEIIEFLWGYHPPEKTVYRIQVEALLGMVTVADKIAATPGILKEKPAGHYADSLWEYLVNYAPQPVIQSILERNVVQWSDYKDKDGNNPILENAIDRARKYTGDDPQILTLVMHDILAHGATWSPSQLAHGFYTEKKGSHVVSSLHTAGITCVQLRKALSDFVVGSVFDDGEQRIKEVCEEEN